MPTHSDVIESLAAENAEMRRRIGALKEVLQSTRDMHPTNIGTAVLSAMFGNLPDEHVLDYGEQWQQLYRALRPLAATQEGHRNE